MELLLSCFRGGDAARPSPSPARACYQCAERGCDDEEHNSDDQRSEDLPADAEALPVSEVPATVREPGAAALEDLISKSPRKLAPNSGQPMMQVCV
jgi:hypothetical protein